MTEPLRRLKTLSKAAIPEAIRRAEHYRLLNDPEQAESICLDVLECDPENQQALVVLILAMTDQFGRQGAADQKAHEYLTKVQDPYQRAYYAGLICERRGRALLGGVSHAFAYEPFHQAMEWYEKAEKLRPSGNDEAILRWNSCLRTIRRHALTPPAEEAEQPLE